MQKRACGGWLVLCAGVLLPGCSGSGSGRRSGDGGGDAGADASLCARPFDLTASTREQPTGLRINEVLSANDGVNLDELGEADDWIELLNTSSAAIELGSYSINDGKGSAAQLPAVSLAPGETYLLWADGAPEQGERHLDLKVSASGEPVLLWAAPCVLAERLEVPALPLNESYARLPDGGDELAICRYATPGRANGESCLPSPPPELPDTISFAPYTWSTPWPVSPGPLAIEELAWGPLGFVELFNQGEQPLSLADFVLRLAPHPPGAALPGAADGVLLGLPSQELAPAARVAIELPLEAQQALGAEGEGVLSLFRSADGTLIDRLDFMRPVPGAALVRDPRGPVLFRFCEQPSRGEQGSCTPLSQRETGDRVRYLRTPGDFSALAAGGTEIGQSAVKFIVDMQAADTVHLLAERWALHYTFIRERIYGEPALDRCDAAQAQLFKQSWYEFSEREYFRSEGRRFLLGTLVAHANGLHTVEFAPGDAISPAQMRRAFFAAVAHTEDPSQWALRAQNAQQLTLMRELEGQLPILSPGAPFVGLSYQPLTHALGFGVLKLVPAAELMQAELGPQVIVVTDDVPNDIPFVGGLITEAFQTPLAHVNVLSQARGTPNMALRGARNHARLVPLLGKLVRLEVGSSDFDVRAATAEEADAFYQLHRPSGPRVVAPHDANVRGVQPLSERGLADLPSIGAKAAQFAELYRVQRAARWLPRQYAAAERARAGLRRAHRALRGALSSQRRGRASGRAGRRTCLSRRSCGAGGRARRAARAHRRPAASTHSCWPRSRRPSAAASATSSVRLRSSSNIEDLPTFNGAGLHTSSSATLDDPDESVADALRLVWASLWNMRAYDEREFANIDHEAARMAVLVHARFAGEGCTGRGHQPQPARYRALGHLLHQRAAGRGHGHQPGARRSAPSSCSTPGHRASPRSPTRR